jgi:hypothetical protein
MKSVDRAAATAQPGEANVRTGTAVGLVVLLLLVLGAMAVQLTRAGAL